MPVSCPRSAPLRSRSHQAGSVRYPISGIGVRGHTCRSLNHRGDPRPTTGTPAHRPYSARTVRDTTSAPLRHGILPSRGRVLRVMTRLNVEDPPTALFLTVSSRTGLRHPSGEGRLRTSRRRRQAGPGLPTTSMPSLTRELRPRSICMRFATSTPDAAVASAGRAHPPRQAGALGDWRPGARRPCGLIHTFHGHVLQEYFSALKSRAFVQANARWRLAPTRWSRWRPGCATNCSPWASARSGTGTSCRSASTWTRC